MIRIRFATGHCIDRGVRREGAQTRRRTSATGSVPPQWCMFSDILEWFATYLTWMTDSPRTSLGWLIRHVPHFDMMQRHTILCVILNGVLRFSNLTPWLRIHHDETYSSWKVYSSVRIWRVCLVMVFLQCMIYIFKTNMK